MKRGVLVIGFLLAITIAGGVLTANLAFSVPTIQQTTDPAASPFMATNGQAFWFLVIVAGVLGGVTIMGVGLAIIFWLLNWQVNTAKEMPTLEEKRQQEAEALPEGKQKALSA